MEACIRCGLPGELRNDEPQVGWVRPEWDRC